MRGALVLAALLVAAQARAETCAVDARQKPRCLPRMLELARDHHLAEGNVSAEMLLCVTWTESGYCNVRRRNSRSVGFGQVVLAAQRSLFHKLAKERKLGPLTMERVLANDGLSLAIASLVLATGMIANGGDVDKALRAYAGPPNHEAVPSWRACERRLAALELFAPESTVDRAAIAEALAEANRHRGKRASRPAPDALFDETRCSR
jgi:hypothetical protein